ncbi:hypothetical protein BpHYR1_015490 [Brachionus plicatilis]|uniref:Uncharacterized protein n=1 Tax=Brachionus plicatilis TaxID=10195 RepID=A0A3M7T0S1_BRAPC|nr:hypothetical protein BpHYR1_015490 [Brachionus plicatilis]
MNLFLENMENSYNFQNRHPLKCAILMEQIKKNKICTKLKRKDFNCCTHHFNKILVPTRYREVYISTIIIIIKSSSSIYPFFKPIFYDSMSFI